jgi:hypothetical protein
MAGYRAPRYSMPVRLRDIRQNYYFRFSCRTSYLRSFSHGLGQEYGPDPIYACSPVLVVEGGQQRQDGKFYVLTLVGAVSQAKS